MIICKTCGVHMFGIVYGPPISIFDKLPPERKAVALEVYHRNLNMQPLSVRTIDDLDISSLKIEYDACGTEGYTLDP